MEPEKIEWLRGWAAKMECKLVIEGMIGWGRPCVGVQERTPSDLKLGPSWLSYQYYGMPGDLNANSDLNQAIRNVAPEDAYHKDDFVCVLGEGFQALEQLYDWCVAIAQIGVTTEVCNEPNYGLGTTSISMLMTGKPGRLRRLIRA